MTDPQLRAVLTNEVGVVSVEAEDDWLTGQACALDADGNVGPSARHASDPEPGHPSR